MIALNEIISNKERFESKYKLMGKRVNLDKIISLEQSFIAKDKQANELRSECNKRCSEIAELINENKDTKSQIQHINKLDKQINKLEKISHKSMQKINAKLKKLPNLALEDNILNIAQKTTPTEFNKQNLLDFLENYKPQHSKLTEKSFLNESKKVVFKKENLPKLLKTKSKRKVSYTYLWLFGENSSEIFDELKNLLLSNAKFLTTKSIKYLKKDCSKEIFAWLADGTRVSVEFLGEYLSRDYMIKFYDKQIDMTKFVQMIRISFS